MTISFLEVRTIVNSGGGPAVEVSLGAHGVIVTASGPSAVAAGTLERSVGNEPCWSLGWASEITTELTRSIANRFFESQESFDTVITSDLALGTALTVPLSIAFARLNAEMAGVPLAIHLARLAGRSRLDSSGPAYLVAMISGGIHSGGAGPSAQQVMLVLDEDPPLVRTHRAVTAHRLAEERLASRGLLRGLGPSSGHLVSAMSTIEAIEFVRDLLPGDGAAVVAIDVAAEHLWTGDGYMVDGRHLTEAQMMDQLLAWSRTGGLGFVEDPFHPSHVESWVALRSLLAPGIELFGDDLFATDAARLDSRLASGTLIKVNQIGSVTGALRAMAAARRLGLKTCVSHRSLETEDPFLCHLAIGAGADYVKLGGPLRGDRTARYNEFLRLSSHLGRRV